MIADRVTVNEPGNWTGPASMLGALDEVVMSDALIHLEAMSDNAAFLVIYKAGTDEDGAVRVWIRARPTTRAERRDILRHDDDRLIDQLRRLRPYDWGGRTIWSVPWWRRPASVWRSWREAVNQARAVLDMREDR